MTIKRALRLLVINQDSVGGNFVNRELNPETFNVVEVNSNKEGLDSTQENRPDVIVINIMQPSTNGWKLCRKIREITGAPILVVAAVSDPGSIATWLDAGADDYLTKPFSTDILVAHVQKLIRRFSLLQNQPSLSPQ